MPPTPPPPERQNSGDPHGRPLPPARLAAQRIPAATFQARFRVGPCPVTNGSLGECFGKAGGGGRVGVRRGDRAPGPGHAQRAGAGWGRLGGWGGGARKGKRWPKATGTLREPLRTWERPGPGRPLGAGRGLALDPWRRGRPGLAQRRRLLEARGFGLLLLLRRRRLVPRPLGRPRSVRKTAALRPAPSAAQAPAPAPTSTWGPIETVRHAPPPPPPPPPGAAAAALRDRTQEEAPRPGSRLGASLGPHGGGGRLAPRLVSSGAPGRADGSLSNPPPSADRVLPSSLPEPGSSALNAPGATAGHSGPPRPGGPGRARRGSSRLRLAGCRGPAGPPCERPPCLPASALLGAGLGGGIILAWRCQAGVDGAMWGRGALTPCGPDLLDGGSPERSARMTVDGRKIKIRGEGAWTQRRGSRTRTSVGAQVSSMTPLPPRPDNWRETIREA